MQVYGARIFGHHVAGVDSLDDPALAIPQGSLPNPFAIAASTSPGAPLS
jgi:hypothetical protein